MSLEISIIAIAKRTIFLVFYKIGFIIQVVRAGLITIIYESKYYGLGLYIKKTSSINIRRNN